MKNGSLRIIPNETAKLEKQSAPPTKVDNSATPGNPFSRSTILQPRPLTTETALHLRADPHANHKQGCAYQHSQDDELPRFQRHELYHSVAALRDEPPLLFQIRDAEALDCLLDRGPGVWCAHIAY
jgi:hypothetical protein